MKCEDCHHDIRPVCVFDLDGTLGKYHKSLHRFCLHYWNLPLISGQEPWDGQGNFEDYIGITQSQYRQAKLAWRQGGMKRTMEPYRELISDVKSLSLRADIWICTTRPWERLDNVDPDTKWWLEQNDVPFKHLLYGENKYEELVGIVDPNRIAIVVDDLVEQVNAARYVGLNAWQVIRPHNAHPTVKAQWRVAWERVYSHAVSVMDHMDKR